MRGAAGVKQQTRPAAGSTEESRPRQIKTASRIAAGSAERSRDAQSKEKAG
jgi:hypothetical protein